MGVRNDELHAPETTAGELAQEGGPERLGRGRADIEAEHLAPSVAVGPDGHNHGDRHDPALLAHLHVGGILACIRREHVQIRKANGGASHPLVGEIRAVSFLGLTEEYIVNVGGVDLRAIQPAQGVVAGEQVDVTIASDECIVLAGN